MTNKEKYDQVFIDSFSITADQLNENLVLLRISGGCGPVHSH